MNSQQLGGRDDGEVESRRGPEGRDGPTASSGAVVALRGVRKVYGRHDAVALHGIDLEIEEGEFFSLLGPSGSGKTTTLRLVGGFELPTSGQILLDGVDVAGVPPYLRDVNTVFQNYALFPHMTVGDNVGYPLRWKKTGRRDHRSSVDAALELVDMGSYRDRQPHELSGGQRQRVALARALVSRPRVVLLDEPLGALDLQLRQSLQLALKHLQREVNTTFIYVTHDQGEALSMSDRIAVMSVGRIEQIGTPTEIYAKPASRFVARFIGKANLIDVDISSSAGGERVGHADGFHFAIGGHAEPGRATVSIRFEALRLTDGGETSEAGDLNRLAGIVEEVVFLGDSEEIVVRVGGLQLTSRRPFDPASPLGRGDQVTVEFSSSAPVVLHD